ncbi:hypothetical protein BKA70DRAFT_1131921 [Coprinopsis sp. MPI-PUGE-AT-0042]|nr:hypothetical protein BKA70DRAFT_1131921 [Coprinopsis sp. MPI-PUGE-AT-0042]
MSPAPARETRTVSATEVSKYQHLQCDLYLHHITRSSFSKRSRDNVAVDDSVDDVAQPHIARGHIWERKLMAWLEDGNHLLTVPSNIATSITLRENILADDREHFFVAGIVFNPPNDVLAQQFTEQGEIPVIFRTMKLDLLEIRREKGRIVWTVIDAKASSFVKTTHQIQVYLYHTCLEHLLQGPLFESSGRVGVWLPPRYPTRGSCFTPCVSDIKTTRIGALAPSIHRLIFKTLPQKLALLGEDVEWHLNPLCSSCEFEACCKAQMVENAHIGTIPNLSQREGHSLRTLINGAVQIIPGFDSIRSTDIEDLHFLVTDAQCRKVLHTHMRSDFEEATAILAVQMESNVKEIQFSSPILESARRNIIKVIPRLSTTCPLSEDFTVVVSVLQDFSTTDGLIKAFHANVYNNLTRGHGPWFSLVGNEEGVISNVAYILRRIKAYRPAPCSVQFYVWLPSEAVALQKHLRKMGRRRGSNSHDEELRQCIHTLAYGTLWACTPFSPPVLNHGLYHFLHKRTQSSGELRGFLSRMGMATRGGPEELRERIQNYIEEVKPGHPVVAPPITTLKTEAERVLALPIPGRWDLAECYSALFSTMPSSVNLPPDTEIFVSLQKGNLNDAKDALSLRTQMVHAVLKSLRLRVQESGNAVFVAIPQPFPRRSQSLCQQTHLKQLFSIQEHEAICRMQDLWSQRADHSHPVTLECIRSEGVDDGINDFFRLLSGKVEIGDGSYRHILIEENEDTGNIPIEFVFDDLLLSGAAIPLGTEAGSRWERCSSQVRGKIQIVDITQVSVDEIVAMHIWTRSRKPLQPGQRYRLIPRLVDFITDKVLACLFECDLRWADARMSDSDHQLEGDHRNIPFIQFIADPASFGKNAMHEALFKVGEHIHGAYDSSMISGGKGMSLLSCGPSQYAAIQSVLSNRLTVIWGPPGLSRRVKPLMTLADIAIGTGKTHTFALALLRLLEAEWRLGLKRTRVIFVTAFMHVAIDACIAKLLLIMNVYRKTHGPPCEWLERIVLEKVAQGYSQPCSDIVDRTHIYVGTLYQASVG